MRRISPNVIRPSGLIETRVPAALRKAVYERDQYTCRDCGLTGKPGRQQGSIQVYHVVSLRDGGEHSLENLVTVCYACRKRRDEEKRKAKQPSRSSIRWRQKKDKK